MLRHNRYRHQTPPGWSDMRTAPRDGTWVEVQNNWGIAPWFGKYRWTNEHAAHTQDGGLSTYTSDRFGWSDGKGSSVEDGAHLSWRPTSQTESYSDPLGGAQNTRAYWLRAAGLKPGDYGAVDGVSFDEEDRLTDEVNAVTPPADSNQLFFVALFAAAAAGLIAIVVSNM